MNQDLVDFSVKYLERLGATYAEAKLEEVKGSGYILKNGNVEISGFDKSTGLGIRFISKGTLGFVAINDLEKNKIKSLINKSFNLTTKASKIVEKVTLS